MEVGLGSGYIVLDGDPQRGTAPNFRPMSVVAKQVDGSRYHSLGRYDIGPGDILLDGDPPPPSSKGHTP